MNVLSHFQAAELLAARQKGLAEVQVSLDLNLTQATAHLTVEGAGFLDDVGASWAELAAIQADEAGCYAWQEGAWQKIQFFSEETGRVYTLYPTQGAPTMLVSGLPMHRIKDTDPHRDTLEKIRAVRPVVGQVLDTATGLGYTAIEAAKTAAHVTTIELDPCALEVARRNPWSQGLFDNPKITQRLGDSLEVVSELGNGTFTRIIHDPPVFALAGHLYSLDMYHELHRVLRTNGRLFHYIGDPESKSGRNVTAGVLRRLEQAGFRELRRAPRAFGVTAVK
jgi:hypothetical protein